MGIRFKIVGKRQPRIVVTSAKQPRIDPKALAKAIGAETVAFDDLSPRMKAIVDSGARGPHKSA